MRPLLNRLRSHRRNRSGRPQSVPHARAGSAPCTVFLLRPFRPRRVGFRRRAGDNDRILAARFVLTENGQKLAEFSAVNPLKKLRQVVRNGGVPVAEDIERVAQETGQTTRTFVKDERMRRAAVDLKKALALTGLPRRETAERERMQVFW